MEHHLALNVLFEGYQAINGAHSLHVPLDEHLVVILLIDEGQKVYHQQSIGRDGVRGHNIKNVLVISAAVSIFEHFDLKLRIMLIFGHDELHNLHDVLLGLDAQQL